jgi:sugar phosphate isomerase/epimerase
MPGTELRAPRIVGSALALATQTANGGLSGPERVAAGADVWRKDLLRLKRSGFDAVDIVDVWLPLNLLALSDIEALCRILDEVGLEALAACITRRSIIEPGWGKENVAQTLRAIDAAAQLGVAVLSVGLHPRLTADQLRWPFWTVLGRRDRSDDATLQLAASRLRELAQHAAAVGVKLSLELYEGSLAGTGASAARLVRLVGHPALGLNPDLGNLFRAPWGLQETWLETLRECLPQMNLWHVKNYRRNLIYPDGPFSATQAPLAAGDIDYRLALGEALDIGFHGPIVVEHYGGDALWNQAQGALYLTCLLEDMSLEASG